MGRDRVWPWCAAILTVLLAAVLVLGAWARWWPTSDHDLTRLAARETLVHWSQSPSGAATVPETVLHAQLEALGPEATPAQRRHLASGSYPVQPPADTAATAERFAELTRRAPDGPLGATLASLTASWAIAADRERHDGDPRPQTGTAASSAALNRDHEHGACAEDASAAVKGVDRARFAVDAAAVTAPERSRSALETARAATEDLLDQPAVRSQLRCAEHPARGAYSLPPRVREAPEQAVATAYGDAADAAHTALVTDAGGQDRDWLAAVLEHSARQSLALTPDAPLPALPGAHTR